MPRLSPTHCFVTPGIQLTRGASKFVVIAPSRSHRLRPVGFPRSCRSHDLCHAARSAKRCSRRAYDMTAVISTYWTGERIDGCASGRIYLAESLRVTDAGACRWRQNARHEADEHFQAMCGKRADSMRPRKHQSLRENTTARSMTLPFLS
ncbi:hypothetical protein DAEQUDRAFT_359677 [Daedalea quercina L-15889]|uniref:Uncharacterized protein n=1 Tax=Daedalea quercina L-15889 TaxID=1314783 RepID=A0A165TSR6_9APHY|nr:hypothetical protein DAEQUDRAFT_359677 [Daedalea quercina L-15889]